jgi:hypothetical protein
LYGKALRPVRAGKGNGCDTNELVLAPGGGGVFGLERGEEAVEFGVKEGVGLEGFGVEAVFAGVGGGFAFAFGGFGAAGFFAVCLGGQD